MRMPAFFRTIRVATTVLSALTIAAASVVSNVLPRLDTTGNIIDAHDGNVLFDAASSTYLYYAAGYGLCKEPTGPNGCEYWALNNTKCGFLFNHSVNLYTSQDLVTWTNEGNVLPVENRVDVVLFSPKVIYHDASQTYVLWYNYVPDYSYAVAISKSRAGPFQTIATTTGNTTQYGYPNNTHVGDFSLFKDDDGKAYLLYSSSAHVQIEPLSDDYTYSLYRTTNQTSGVFKKGNEAPAMFKRNGMYYALVSEACCYCQPGGLVYAYMASAPLGPYSYIGEIAAGPNPFHGDVATSSQQTNVFRVPGATPADDQFVWQGDRWQSAPDGLKGHDFTYWSVLEFAANGSIVHMSWQNTTNITGVWEPSPSEV